MRVLVPLLACASAPVAWSFVQQGSPLSATLATSRTCMSLSAEQTRRGVLQGAVKGATVFAAAIAISSPAFAAVGEGNLPDEAYAFLKLIQLQKDWAAIGKTVREREDVAGDEWQNVQLYLRKMYQQGEELKGMAKGFAEPKRAQALALVEAVRAEARAADKPAGARDRDAFLAAQRSIEAKIGEFVDLFQDVPDEL